MDYCSSCRRHLNGALVCPGCGAYAPDIDPHVGGNTGDTGDTGDSGDSAGARPSAAWPSPVVIPPSPPYPRPAFVPTSVPLTDRPRSNRGGRPAAARWPDGRRTSAAQSSPVQSRSSAAD
ncbi:SCO2400 family protein [Streptomyces tendae]|uniref:SCO2400 family protein n=1 Tax=Streptomyces tendae TaxID=1932 RepID=UPI004032E2DD